MKSRMWGHYAIYAYSGVFASFGSMSFLSHLCGRSQEYSMHCFVSGKGESLGAIEVEHKWLFGWSPTKGRAAAAKKCNSAYAACGGMCTACQTWLGTEKPACCWDVNGGTGGSYCGENS